MFSFLTRFFTKSSSQYSVKIPSELTRQRLPLGPHCERIARWFLEEKKGMTVIEQNARTHVTKEMGRVTGEIDLIMEANDQNRTIVFVEVRSRSQNWNVYGTPLSAISPVKQKKVCHAARKWLHENQISVMQPIRFDVVGIIWPENEEPEILYCSNAFTWLEPNWKQGNIRIH